MENTKPLGFLFSEDRILLPEREERFREKLVELFEKKRREEETFWHYGGKYGDCGLFWGEIPPSSENMAEESMHFVNLRDAATLYGYSCFSLATKITHLRHWQKRTRFCGACGTPTIPLKKEEHARTCPQCGNIFYPQISPAVIVRIEKKGSILLARNARFPATMRSLIAGFVDPGESLEDAVRREIREEVGISVKDITYYDSQPWPFPDSLMVGFTAQWKEGEILVDNDEILEAGWFSPEELPELPRSGSIAYKMIQQWILQNKPS